MLALFDDALRPLAADARCGGGSGGDDDVGLAARAPRAPNAADARWPRDARAYAATVATDLRAHNITLAACARDARRARDLLAAMLRGGGTAAAPAADVVSCNCGRGGQPAAALALLRMMRRRSGVPVSAAVAPPPAAVAPPSPPRRFVGATAGAVPTPDAASFDAAIFQFSERRRARPTAPRCGGTPTAAVARPQPAAARRARCGSGAADAAAAR